MEEELTWLAEEPPTTLPDDRYWVAAGRVLVDEFEYEIYLSKD